METSYLSATAALIWLALYYLPVGGALFRLALPLPLALLLMRRGWRAGVEGVLLTVLLLVALMGPVRGPLILFPYGLLSLWLGWCWLRGKSWWISWSVGTLIGAAGFLVRVVALSLLLGENLWVVITRAGDGLLNGLIGALNNGLGVLQIPFRLTLAPDLEQVQLMALGLVILQQLIYVLALHALAYWIFPRLQAPVPTPPKTLEPLLALDPL
ncbi:MAG: DUF2232 domain-containing protein [Synechococcus sp.]|nr:DUF2232 domain-containing protein [Synechococcus sp.]